MSNKSNTIVAYKGFNPDWTCRDFQYKVGETYEHGGEVRLCDAGFHACENPLDVFAYYGPVNDDGKLNTFAVVECSGEINREENGDTKIACERINVKVEIKIHELLSKAADWINDRIKIDYSKVA